MDETQPVLVTDPACPENTVYIFHPDTYRFAALEMPPLRFHEDLWGSRSTWPREAEDQRRQALAFLEDLLDDWCTEEGWDPHEVWRTPRWIERRRQADRIAYMANERIALALHRPHDVAKIVVP